MKKIFVIFICLVVVFSFSACTNKVKFTETEDKTIVTIDGTEYTFIGYEGSVWCFGEWEFIGHVKGEKKRRDFYEKDIRYFYLFGSYFFFFRLYQ